MSRASRDKGARWQRVVRDYLDDRGVPCTARSCGESGDDLVPHNVPWLSIELKDHGTMNLAAWVDQARRQADERGCAVAVVWHHRKGKASPADGYVTLRGDDFVRVLDALRDIPIPYTPTETTTRGVAP